MAKLPGRAPVKLSFQLSQLTEAFWPLRPGRQFSGRCRFATNRTIVKRFVLQVLFPLLDKVAIESGLASTEKSGDSLLIHHSRNTEQKQWSETQVLTISGVARVFVTKRSLLHTLGDFPKAWRLLLEHIEKLSLSATQEVRVKSSSTFKLCDSLNFC